MRNPSQALLEVADEEKDVRGIRHTPREISPQPDSWGATCQKCQHCQAEISSFLKRSGIGFKDLSAPSCFLRGRWHVRLR